MAIRENGYSVIPITSPNEGGPKAGKAPRLKDWQTVEDTDENILAWGRNPSWGNTGLRCGELVVVDIDVPHAVLADAIEALAREKLGDTPLRRVGNAPKLALLYRCEGEPFAKTSTPEMSLPDGTKVQVEILAEGQQVVAFGLHPDTGREYSWEPSGPDPDADGRSPETVPLSELPVVTNSRVEVFLAQAQVQLEAGDAVAKPKAALPPGRAASPATRGDTGQGGGFFRMVNEAALANIEPWARALFDDRLRRSGQSWRVAAKDLGPEYQGLEETLSLYPGGIRDFAQEKPQTPISVVMEHGGPAAATEAAHWLCEQLGVVPADLGWVEPRGRGRPRKERDATDPRYENLEDAIRVNPGELHLTVEAAEAALVRLGSAVYQRGGTLVCVGYDPAHTHKALKAGGPPDTKKPCIITMTPPRMCMELSRAATWTRYDARAKEDVRTDAPQHIADALLANRGAWRKLPPLKGILLAPTMRRDGTLLTEPGYDLATGLYLDTAGLEMPAIPEQPTKANAMEALSVLWKELYCGFPFVGTGSRSVALSAALTALVRPVLRTAPMHAFTAPKAGTGKSMIAEVAGILALGREPGAMGQGKTEEELEKRLDGEVLSGSPLIFIDNCERELSGDRLCQVTERGSVKLRPLGRTESIELPTVAFVMATGNNLVISKDMTRRSVLCSLDAETERPETRAFDFSPPQRAMEKRGRYIAAALTVLRAFHCAGRPPNPDTKPIGSYQEWCELVRNALLWMGEEDPLATMSEVSENDPARNELLAVITAWKEAFGDRDMRAQDVAEKAECVDEDGKTPLHKDLRDALMHVAGSRGEVDSRRLGMWLAKNAKSPVGDMRITSRLANGNKLWRLERTDGSRITPISQGQPPTQVDPFEPSLLSSHPSLH